MIGNRYGPGTGIIWLDNVHCVGNETSIADCNHAGWRLDHLCNHIEDVSVSCGLNGSLIFMLSIIFSARQHAERAICYRKSVCLSVRLSVCHTGGSVKNG